MFEGLGVVTRREVVTAARRKGWYQTRCALVVGLLLAVGYGAYVEFPHGPGGWEVPAWKVRASARRASAAAVGILAVAVLALAHDVSLAEERERGTLAMLLTSRLEAFEIVAGKLAAILARCVMVLVAGVPVLVLLDRLGGGEPWLVVLTCAGLASWALSVAALSLAASVEAPTEKLARAWALGILAPWFEGPFMLALLGPSFFPASYSWVRVPNLELLTLSPMCVAAHLMGLVPRPSLTGLVVRMVVYQTVLAVALTAWAAVRLRPAARRLTGAVAVVRGSRVEGRWFQGRWRGRWQPRPPCGDDPMDWKERYTSRPGWFVKSVGVATYFLLFAILGYMTQFVARPAWAEMRAMGYSSMTSGDFRWSFNQAFLRPMAGMFTMCLLLMVAGPIAEGLAMERKRDTWLSLLATPLTGREILGSKQSASLRRSWPLNVFAATLLVVGLSVGAVHPLGALAASVAWCATMRLATALGGYLAIYDARSEGGGDVLVLASLPLALAAGFLPWAFGGRPELAPFAAISTPFLSMLALMTGPDVRALFGHGEPSGVALLRIAGRPGGAAWLAAAVAIGLVVLILAARRFDREVDRTFDAAVGRTDRDGPPSAVERIG